MEMDSKCPNCDRDIQPPDTQGGRPRRWCSAGCQRSGEARMRRINLVLKRLELDKVWQQRHSHHPAMIERIDELIAERQRQYDHLAGCPQVRNERKQTKMTDPREMLRTAMNAIHQQPDSGLLPAFQEAIDIISDGVEMLTRDDNDTKAQAWHRAAIATKRLLRDYSEDVKTEWIAAYADLPPMDLL